jgi:hypothetical protein
MGVLEHEIGGATPIVDGVDLNFGIPLGAVVGRIEAIAESTPDPGGVRAGHKFAFQDREERFHRRRPRGSGIPLSVRLFEGIRLLRAG